MKRYLHGCAIVALLALIAAPAAAQSLYGQVDLIIDRSYTTFGGTKGFTKLFTQSYTVGYQSILGDPRLGTYLAELTFLRSDIRSTTQDGYSRNFGYNLGANLFPNRPFPFSVTATRTTGATSPDFAGLGFVSGGASGVPLPPGYVPERYDTKLSSLDLNWQVIVPSWPLFQVNYRRDTGATTTGPYEGTEKNRYLTTVVEKNWRRTRNQLNYTRYSGESNATFPLDRSQTELLYNLSADLTDTLRLNGRAGYRDISSTFTFASLPGDTGSTATPPILSNDLASRYASGGVTYQPTSRLGLDALTGYELLSFDRDGREASSDAFYTIGSVRYLVLEGLTLTGNADSAQRSEQIGGVTRDGAQRGVGGGFSYTRAFGAVQPVVGASRGIGRTDTVDGREGDTSTSTRRAGASVNLGRWLLAGTDYDDAEATDDVFSLGNFTRRRWQVNGQSRPRERLRLDATWERTSLDQGLGADRLQSDYRYGQGGATWQLGPRQSVGGRFGSWRTESGDSVTHTTYGVGSYLAYFRSFRVQAEFIRDDVKTETPSLLTNRNVYRFQGFIEYRLRLFTFGFDYRYANNAQTDLSRYKDNQWRIRISRRFGAGYSR